MAITSLLATVDVITPDTEALDTEGDTAEDTVSMVVNDVLKDTVGDTVAVALTDTILH